MVGENDVISGGQVLEILTDFQEVPSPDFLSLPGHPNGMGFMRTLGFDAGSDNVVLDTFTVIDNPQTAVDQLQEYIDNNEGRFLDGYTPTLHFQMERSFANPVLPPLDTVHDFTVKAVGSDGEIATNSVSASVHEYGEDGIPFGIFGRVTDALLEKPYGDRLGHHPVEMVTNDGELWVGRSVEHAYAYEISLRDKTLRILAPIHKAPPGAPFSEFGCTSAATRDAGPLTHAAMSAFLAVRWCWRCGRS